MSTFNLTLKVELKVLVTKIEHLHPFETMKFQELYNT